MLLASTPRAPTPARLFPTHAHLITPSQTHSTDPRSFSVAWHLQTAPLEALLVGFLEEEDLPATNCCVFLGLGGRPGSVGYIPTCDRAYQCSYLRSQFLPPPRDLSESIDTRPQHPGLQGFISGKNHEGVAPSAAKPFFSLSSQDLGAASRKPLRLTWP